jgi:hypothetical protein
VSQIDKTHPGVLRDRISNIKMDVFIAFLVYKKILLIRYRHLRVLLFLRPPCQAVVGLLAHLPRTCSDAPNSILRIAPGIFCKSFSTPNEILNHFEVFLNADEHLIITYDAG